MSTFKVNFFEFHTKEWYYTAPRIVSQSKMRVIKLEKREKINIGLCFAYFLLHSFAKFDSHSLLLLMLILYSFFSVSSLASRNCWLLSHFDISAMFVCSQCCQEIQTMVVILVLIYAAFITRKSQFYDAPTSFWNRWSILVVTPCTTTIPAWMGRLATQTITAQLLPKCYEDTIWYRLFHGMRRFSMLSAAHPPIWCTGIWSLWITTPATSRRVLALATYNSNYVHPICARMNFFI